MEAALQKAREGIIIMADAGVKDVVYFFYPTVPNGTLIGGLYPNAMNDWARPQAKQVCDNAVSQSGGRLRCHWIDMVPVFQGHADWFAAGDIHPNTLGSAAMAKEIVGVMKRDCVAQKSSSGCCG